MVLVFVALVVTYAIAAAVAQAFWLPLLTLIVLGGIGFALAFTLLFPTQRANWLN